MTNEQVVFLLGANHRTAPLELREALFIPEEPLAVLLPAVKEQFGFLELAALSTCNRFELIGVAPEVPGLPKALIDAYLELHRSHGALGGKFTEEQLKSSVYMHLRHDAVSHLYRVASSLDSLVLGETQITGQFKDALALAARTETLGPTLTRLGQEALATAKKVRNQTAIGRKNVSISHAAIELAKKVFGDLSDHKFLLVGAGEMALVAAKYIRSYKPKQIFVANRSIENARKLVAELNFGEAFTLDELPSLLVQADVVISSTAAPGIVIEANLVRRAQAARRGRPLVLLDIALPRDIDVQAGSLEDVYLFDIDDLKQVVDQNYEERRQAAEDAESVVARGVESFEAWRRTLRVKPALAQFRAYLDQIVAKERQRTFAREHMRDITDKQRESLDAMLIAIAGKVAADAARQVTSPPEGFYPEQLADTLSALFNEAAVSRKGSA